MSTLATTAINEMPLWALLSISALLGATFAGAGAHAFGRFSGRRPGGLGGGDSVTGAASRREFVAQLESNWEAHRTGELKIGLLVIDIDRFADINQLYGREIGDKVLTEVAERICLRVRSGDLLGRIDADEFGVICRDVSLEDLEDLRIGLEAYVNFAETVPVHLSIGVAVPHLADETSFAMLARARRSMRNRRSDQPARVVDEALYELLTPR